MLRSKTKFHRFKKPLKTSYQKRIIDVDLNATQAALRAKYSPKFAERSGFDNTRNYKVQKEIKRSGWLTKGNIQNEVKRQQANLAKDAEVCVAF